MFGQFEHLMVELRIEDLAGFQNFVRCQPAMFQEMVNRLTPLICKLDTNYHKALDPGMKVAITLHYMATGDSSKGLQYGFRVAYNTICVLIAEVSSTIVSSTITLTTLDNWMVIANTNSHRWQYHHCLGQSMVSMWPSENL